VIATHTLQPYSLCISNVCKELGDKAASAVLLASSSKYIIVPNEKEWIGIGLLERDDLLVRR